MSYICTHRCYGSIAQHVSIRKYVHGDGSVAWVLAHVEYDFDYDYCYLNQAAYITYCPFCGERLDE